MHFKPVAAVLWLLLVSQSLWAHNYRNRIQTLACAPLFSTEVAPQVSKDIHQFFRRWKNRGVPAYRLDPSDQRRLVLQLQKALKKSLPPSEAGFLLFVVNRFNFQDASWIPNDVHQLILKLIDDHLEGFDARSLMNSLEYLALNRAADTDLLLRWQNEMLTKVYNLSPAELVRVIRKLATIEMPLTDDFLRVWLSAFNSEIALLNSGGSLTFMDAGAGLVAFAEVAPQLVGQIDFQKLAKGPHDSGDRHTLIIAFSYIKHVLKIDHVPNLELSSSSKPDHTPVQDRLLKMLKTGGYDVRAERWFDPIHSPVDLYVSSRKTAIELDGTAHYETAQDGTMNLRLRDRHRDAILRAIGVKVIRIKNFEFNENPLETYGRVVEELGGR